MLRLTSEEVYDFIFKVTFKSFKFGISRPIAKKLCSLQGLRSDGEAFKLEEFNDKALATFCF